MEEFGRLNWRHGSGRGWCMEEVARPKELGGAIVDSGVTATRGHALRDHGNGGQDVVLGA